MLTSYQEIFQKKYHYIIEPKTQMRYIPTYTLVVARNKLVYIGTETQCKNYQSRRENRHKLKDSEIAKCNVCFAYWIRKSLSAFSAN